MKTKTAALETIRPLATSRSFPPRRDYASLSIKDLLDAREAYHVFLSSLENVVATAIGRYMIHEKDWFAKHPPTEPRPDNVKKISEPKTLANTVMRPWSWPAVLVFVKQWESAEKLGSNTIPRTLYLPDGRTVPTCVVVARPDESLPHRPALATHASELIGANYPCLREHQGEQSTGTISCLVRKAGSYYALTSRHVAGGEGEKVFARVRQHKVEIGQTSNIAVDRLLMSVAFPDWNVKSTYLNVDSGLIYINDIQQWTSQAFGIGEIGDIFDATCQSVTLDLIGCPVRAFGGATGVAEGEITALFFRYQSMGGMDYATDLLIGPRRNENRQNLQDLPFTNPGDSGAMWFYDPPIHPERARFEGDEVPVGDRGQRARRLRPIALQWGGQRVLQPNGQQSAFALASFASTVCRSLDAEVIRNWSTGHEEYWGKIGHFAIGWKACDQLSGPLSRLMKANQVRIGFGDEDLRQGSGFRMGRQGYVPLADVPDYVWVASRPYEPIQHFADIDIYDIDGGASMLKRCHDDPQNISAATWKQYFDGFAAKGVGPEEGCLPFRVWQLWDAMV
ncbi:MAG: hypothetical protein JWO95_2044, partial [Verrucomicrobiales bacterium]|nr:hypothetical protein [Verrucomicrobiales bacterium]